MKEVFFLIPILLLHIIFSVFCGKVCSAILKEKGYTLRRVRNGFAWGFFLQLLGIIICLSRKKITRSSTTSKSTVTQTTTSGGTTPKSTPTRTTTSGGTAPKSTPTRTTTSGGTAPKSIPTQTTTSRKATTLSDPRTTNRVPVVSKEEFAEKVKTLLDERDKKTGVSEEHQKRVAETKVVESESGKTKGKKSYSSTDGRRSIELDMSWCQGMAELIEATELVYTNAELSSQSRLSREMFQYYINLHYRSFTAADLCYAKLQELYKVRDEFSAIIGDLRDESKSLYVSSGDYKQITSIFRTLKDLISYLSKRLKTLNQQTAIIRDKIRDECGEIGKTWYDDLEKRREGK